MPPPDHQHNLILLIPAYNEEDRIGPVLRDYADYFKKHFNGEFKIVVVLNGCTDNTLGIVQEVNADFPMVQALEFKEPIGKGGALIEGLKLAPQASLIGYVDADGATSPKAFMDLVDKVDQSDCVIASRWMQGAVIHQTQTNKRQFASRVFHFIVQSLFWMNIKDTQCGAKVMHRRVIEKVHSSLRIADMAFDINLLYSIKRARVFDTGSPHRMDGYHGFKSRPRQNLPDHAAIGHPRAPDLFALLCSLPPLASTGDLDLFEA